MTPSVTLLILAPMAAVMAPALPYPYSYGAAALSLLFSCVGLLLICKTILSPLRSMTAGEHFDFTKHATSPAQGPLERLAATMNAQAESHQRELGLARLEAVKLRQELQECHEINEIILSCQNSALDTMRTSRKKIQNLRSKLYEADSALTPAQAALETRALDTIAADIQCGESYLGRINAFLKNSTALNEYATNDEPETFVQWQECYTTGIAVVDKQHKMLISYINRLYRGIQNGGDQTLLLEVLDALAGYAFTHFNTEEIFFVNSRYPLTEKHMQTHQQFREKVVQFREAALDGKAHVDISLLEFLKDWLIEHIQKMDTGITSYVSDTHDAMKQ